MRGRGRDQRAIRFSRRRLPGLDRSLKQEEEQSRWETRQVQMIVLLVQRLSARLLSLTVTVCIRG